MEKDLDMKLYNEYLETGNSKAFEMLYVKYIGKLKFFIYNIVKDQEKAEDIAQETFIYILKNKIQDKYSFKFHIYLVAKSRAISYVNNENKRNEIQSKYLSAEEYIEKDVADYLIKDEEKSELLDALNQIDEKYRNAIYLTKIEELSYSETAKILDCSVQDVKNHIHRGKFALRKILIKKGFNNMNKLSKVVIFILCLLLLSGITYAATYYITNVWKEPERFNYEEEAKVTEKDKLEAITEENAKLKGLEILGKLGIKDVNSTYAKLVKYPDKNQMRWQIGYDNDISITLDAYTGRFMSYYNFTDDTNIKSTYTKEQARGALQEVYDELNLGFGEEYSLVRFEKVLIDDDSLLWTGDFCKIYDGIENRYECVRLTIIPETKQLNGLTIFDYITENNPVEIDEGTAIQIAKDKANKIRNGQGEIQEISAKLSFEVMNPYIYSMEQKVENIIEMQDNTTKDFSTDETISYRTEQLVRKVWLVHLKYKSELFADEMKIFVDATTGETIGGDSIK